MSDCQAHGSHHFSGLWSLTEQHTSLNHLQKREHPLGSFWQHVWPQNRTITFFSLPFSNPASQLTSDVSSLKSRQKEAEEEEPPEPSHVLLKV